MSLPELKKYHKQAYPFISPFRPELSQNKRVVVVAGGSSGIGFAIARSFVTAGSDRVIILGRRKDVVEAAAAKLNAESTIGITDGWAVDIASPQSVHDFWTRLHSEKVYVDVLVLNAAAFGNSLPILQNGMRNTWIDFEVNVRGPLDMTEHFYKQKAGNRAKKYLVNVSTIATYMWTTMGPERPTYGLTKNAGTALMQQIAKDTSVTDMQVVSFHPGGVLTEAARKVGLDETSGIQWDDENLPGNFAVWAATEEAAYLHGRFVWANWDMEEFEEVLGKKVRNDEHFLKVGIEGLTEKTGGAVF